jgi:hypothetical protein
VCCSGAPAGACAPPSAPVPAMVPGSKTCCTAPGREAAGCCGIFGFFLLTQRSLIRVSGCQGGDPLRSNGEGAPRPGLDARANGDYIAWPFQEEKTPQQLAAVVRLPGAVHSCFYPGTMAGAEGGARARYRCPRGTQPGSKRPIEPHSVAAGRGVGAPSPHAVRPPTPAPRPAPVCAACPPVRTGPATAVRQH